MQQHALRFFADDNDDAASEGVDLASSSSSFSVSEAAALTFSFLSNYRSPSFKFTATSAATTRWTVSDLAMSAFRFSGSDGGSSPSPLLRRRLHVLLASGMLTGLASIHRKSKNSAVTKILKGLLALLLLLLPLVAAYDVLLMFSSKSKGESVLKLTLVSVLIIELRSDDMVKMHACRMSWLHVRPCGFLVHPLACHNVQASLHLALAVGRVLYSNIAKYRTETVIKV